MAAQKYAVGGGEGISVVLTRTPEDDLFIARIAERQESYEVMVEAVTAAVQGLSGSVNHETFSLYSVAHKNLAGSYLRAIRVIQNKLCTEEAADEALRELLNTMQYKALQGLCKVVQSAVDCADTCLSNEGNGTELDVLNLKMKADYYKYVSEAMPSSSEGFPGLSRKCLRWTRYNRSRHIQGIDHDHANAKR